MNAKRSSTLLLAGLFGLALLAPMGAWAQSSAQVQVQMQDMQWTPAASGASFVWLSGWQLEAAASVFDSSAGHNSGYKYMAWTPGAAATAQATTSAGIVSASGQASVDSQGTLTLLQSSLEIGSSRLPLYYSAFASSTAYGEFEITGGSGLIDVLFTFDYRARYLAPQSGSATALGWNYLAGVRLSDGVTTWDLTASGFRSSTGDELYGGTLSRTFSLQYDTPYSMTLLTDPETGIPEPSCALLVVWGLLLARLTHRATGRRES